VIDTGCVGRPMPPTAEEKVIAAARKVLAMREPTGLLPATIETTSALQELAVLIQWMDAEQASRWHAGAGYGL
jgi:hypothetical protein